MFECDRLEHQRILLARRTARDFRRLPRIGEGIEYTASVRLLELKLEPVEGDGTSGPLVCV